MGYKANVGYDNQAICNLVCLQYRKPNQQTNNQKLVLQVYPNPSNGLVKLQLPASGPYQLFVCTTINALGEIVKKWNSAHELHILDLGKAGISNGLYFIQAQSEDGKMHQQKFIYQR